MELKGSQRFPLSKKSTVHLGKHCSDPCTLTVSDLLCNPLVKHSAATHSQRNPVPCWWRCRQSHMASKNGGPGAYILIPQVTHSHKQYGRPFQMPVCISHPRQSPFKEIFTFLLRLPFPMSMKCNKFLPLLSNFSHAYSTELQNTVASYYVSVTQNVCCHKIADTSYTNIYCMWTNTEEKECFKYVQLCYWENQAELIEPTFFLYIIYFLHAYSVNNKFAEYNLKSLC